MMRLVRTALLLLPFCALPLAAEDPTGAGPSSVPDLPRLAALEARTESLLGEGRLEAAEALVNEALGQTPDLAGLQILRARLRMARNDPEGALAALEDAVARGYGDLDRALETPALAPLRAAAEARGLPARSAALPPRPTPARPEGAVLPVGPENLDWNSEIGRFAVLMDPLPAAAAVIPPEPARPRPDRQAAHANLSRLINAGQAAGFSGILYDNRDAGHSDLDIGQYPGLTAIRYHRGQLRPDLIRGLAEDLMFGAPVIGNSSTAFKRGAAPRSLPRAAMTDGYGPVFAYQNYLLNQFYVYPEHRDHDAVDLYPANWPYMIISQGSSYQDRPFVAAAAWALAAMRPETRALVEREKLVVPTLQMILRRSQAHVRNRATYLSGAAHPTVFQQDALRYDRIVALAQSLTPETIPPVPVLKVLSENFAPRAGLLGRSERLFETPAAVARVWRGPEWEKEMIVAAAALGPPLAPDARFEWVLLRGDPARVRIEPLDAQGNRARLVVNWHDRRPTAPRETRLTDRVDIAVIITQGAVESAPAFVSVSFPTHQDRRYTPTEAAAAGPRRLASVDYDALAAGRGYDPLLHWSAPWQDVYAYDDSRMTGWTRIFHDGRPDRRFLADGRFETGQEVAYTLDEKKNGWPLLSIVTPTPPATDE